MTNAPQQLILSVYPPDDVLVTSKPPLGDVFSFKEQRQVALLL